MEWNRKTVFRALARLVLVAVLLSVSIPRVRADSPKPYTIMTYNLYQGTELKNTIAATTSTQLVLGVAADYNNVIATNFPQRAAAIAAEIAQDKPQLVALQEVALWRTAFPYDPTHPTLPTTVSYDFLQILLNALLADNLHYTVVNVSTNYDMFGPGLFSFGFMGVRITDRNAIIARTDEITVSNPQGSNYQNFESVPTFVGPVPVKGSWISVDIGTGSKTFRFVTTHLLGAVLDGSPDPVYPLQAQELLSGAASSGLPIVIVGDLNSNPGSQAYNVFTGAGFTDEWATLHPSAPRNHQSRFPAVHAARPHPGAGLVHAVGCAPGRRGPLHPHRIRSLAVRPRRRGRDASAGSVRAPNFFVDFACFVPFSSWKYGFPRPAGRGFVLAYKRGRLARAGIDSTPPSRERLAGLLQSCWLTLIAQQLYSLPPQLFQSKY